MTSDDRPVLTRRGALAAGGAAILGAAGGFALARASAVSTPAASEPIPTPAAPTPTPAAPASAAPVPAAPVPTPAVLPGPYQPGVTTPAPRLQTFVGLDLRHPRRADARAVMRLLTDDSARLMAGTAPLADPEPALVAGPGAVVVTVGIARRLLERLGLAERIPAELVPIPAFSTDALEPDWPQTDLLLQVGSDDPLALSHAIRTLVLAVSTLTRTRWSQPGFRGPAVSGTGATRNLMGQVDGTVNPTPAQMSDAVWLPDGPHWSARGTVLVLRRIRMHLDEWSMVDPVAQERIIGRRLVDGAPLGAAGETDPLPLDAVDDRGLPVIDPGAHVRVAHAAHPGQMILRRPYSYDGGPGPAGPDAGLLFAAYTRDPRTSFIPMQQRIAESDAFNTWNTTIGSAAYLIPGGVRDGEVLAASAFA